MSLGHQTTMKKATISLQIPGRKKKSKGNQKWNPTAKNSDHAHRGQNQDL